MITVPVTPTLLLQMHSYDSYHRGHNNNDDNYLDRQILQDVHVSSRQTLDSINDKSKYTDAGVNRVGASILADANDHVASAVAGNERLQFTLRDTVEKQSTASRDAVERTGLASTTTTKKNGTQLYSAVERNGTALALGIERIGSTNITNQERIVGAQTVQQEHIAAETRSMAYQHHNAASLASKDILADMYKIKCESEALAYKNSASVELGLCKVKDTLSMQLTECCCEIKNKIGEEAKKRLNN